jgi:hypothetical protein
MWNLISQMSRPALRILAGTLCALVHVVHGVPRAAGAEADGSDLLKRVQTVYGENRNAIQSVEFDFTADINGNLRRARYARDGEREYIAGIYVVPGGLSMPKESAWDGQRVHDRPFLNRLNQSTDKERFVLSTPLPEKALNRTLVYALGFESRKDRKHRFLRAKTIETKRGSCIELEFAADWFGGLLVAHHAQRYNYAPVYWRLTGKDGKTVTEMVEADFATIQSDGNELYYPSRVTIVTLGGPDQGGGRNSWRIDEATLKINKPIPRSRFVLEPWPCEDVFDWEKQRTTPAKDAGWSPVGKVAFPWDDFTRLVEEANQKSPPVAARAGGPTTADVNLSARRPVVERLGGWLVVPGAAVVLASGYVIYRRRHPRA